MEKLFLHLTDTLPWLEQDLPFAVDLKPRIERMEERDKEWIIEGVVAWRVFSDSSKGFPPGLFQRSDEGDGGFADWEDDEESEVFSRKKTLEFPAPVSEPLVQQCPFKVRMLKNTRIRGLSQGGAKGIFAALRREGYRIIVDLVVALEFSVFQETSKILGRDWASLEVVEEAGQGEVLVCHLALDECRTAYDGSRWKLEGKLTGQMVFLGDDGQLRLVTKSREVCWYWKPPKGYGNSGINARLEGVEPVLTPDGRLELVGDILFLEGRNGGFPPGGFGEEGGTRIQAIDGR